MWCARFADSEYSSGSPSDTESIPEDTDNSYSPKRNKKKKKQQSKKRDTSPPKKDVTPPPEDNTKAKEAVKKNFSSTSTQSEELSPPVHEELAGPWGEVAQNGLPVEERDALIAKYPRSSNCPFLRPPDLNREIAKVVGSFQTKRDDRLSRKQSQLSAALTGVAKLMASFITAEDAVGKQHFDDLAAVSRLLLDSFHEENNIRRALISSNLDETVAEALKDTVSGQWLFGDNVIERIKAFKAFDQSVLEICRKKLKPKNPQDPPQVKTPVRQAKRGGHTLKSGKVSWNVYPKNRQSRASDKRASGRSSSTHRPKGKRSLSNRR